MAIQMRRGNDTHFDATKMESGEFASVSNAQKLYHSFTAGTAKEVAMMDDVEALVSEEIAGIEIPQPVVSHAELTERDAADQHPIEAIRGLRAELDEQRIIATATGESIVLIDSSDKPLEGLVLYGKTTQNGTPSPTNPIPLVSAGNNGNITLTISDNANGNTQTLTISTPNGLPGIPVTTGGNYTDENGQQWICDEVDFARGVYVKRVIQNTFNGSEDSWIIDTGAKNAARVSWPEAVGGWGVPLAVASHFKYDADQAYVNNAGHFAIDGEGLCYFATGLQTLSDFKAWAANNPFTVICKCATPTETPLTAEEIAAYQALHTNKPVTTILNDGGAGMSVSYVADTKTYIDNKFAALEAAILSTGGNV